ADRNVRLWALGDAFRDRLTRSLNTLRGNAALAPRIDVPAARQFVGFDAYRQVIGSGVDVVLLCAPPGFRPAHLPAALQAGKRVLAEKPGAVDGPGVRSVLASAEEARRRRLSIVSGLCYRYHQAMRDVIQRVHDGAVGDITALQCNFYTGTLWLHARQPGWSD